MIKQSSVCESNPAQNPSKEKWCWPSVVELLALRGVAPRSAVRQAFRTVPPTHIPHPKPPAQRGRVLAARALLPWNGDPCSAWRGALEGGISAGLICGGLRDGVGEQFRSCDCEAIIPLGWKPDSTAGRDAHRYFSDRLSRMFRPRRMPACVEQLIPEDQWPAYLKVYCEPEAGIRVIWMVIGISIVGLFRACYRFHDAVETLDWSAGV